jgi:hypothetical protein
MKKNSKHAGLAQENGFGSVQFHSLPWLVKCAATLCTSRKECNKYDMTTAQYF